MQNYQDKAAVGSTGKQSWPKEFGSWPVDETKSKDIDYVRSQFTTLLTAIEGKITDPRYFALVKTKLEEACLFAVKGITVPYEKN